MQLTKNLNSQSYLKAIEASEGAGIAKQLLMNLGLARDYMAIPEADYEILKAKLLKKYPGLEGYSGEFSESEAKPKGTRLIT